jgi:hypothetical protein
MMIIMDALNDEYKEFDEDVPPAGTCARVWLSLIVLVDFDWVGGSSVRRTTVSTSCQQSGFLATDNVSDGMLMVC